MRISTVIEWDMAHRLPNHNSKCRNIHGHRYRLEVTISGEIDKNLNSTTAGMVVDFGEIKELLKNIISDLDHSLMLFENDQLKFILNEFDNKLKITSVPFMPTCEEIVAWLSELITNGLRDWDNVYLESLVLYETPTNSAVWIRS